MYLIKLEIEKPENFGGNKLILSIIVTYLRYAEQLLTLLNDRSVSYLVTEVKLSKLIPLQNLELGIGENLRTPFGQ